MSEIEPLLKFITNESLPIAIMGAWIWYLTQKIEKKLEEILTEVKQE